MKRFKLFLAWYKQLRKETSIDYGVIGNLTQGYTVINCCLWAWHNSRTHNLNGEYK